MANKIIKKVGLTPVQPCISSILKNTWSTARVTPTYIDKCFEIKSVLSEQNKEWRGCIAKKDIKAGDTIVEIPWSSVIAVKAINNDSDEILAFSLYRKVFKSDNHVWKEYANMLPSNEELHGSLFWDVESINQLQLQSNEHKEMMDNRIRLSIQEDQIMDLLKLKNMSDDEKEHVQKKVSWCQRIVQSRSFAVGDKLQWRCLIPIADLFNHRPEAPWTQTSLSNKGMLSNPWKVMSLSRGKPKSVQLLCAYDTKLGNEILIPYGYETNLELIRSYGFILPMSVNEAQYVPLFSDMEHLVSYVTASIGHVSDKKVEILKNIDAYDAPLAIRPGKLDHSSHLLSCVMFLLCEDGDVEKFEEKMNTDVGHFVLTAARIDMTEALRFVAHRCHEILKEMPTTINEDRAIYQQIENQGEMQEVEQQRMKLALEYRMDVKELLLCATRW